MIMNMMLQRVREKWGPDHRSPPALSRGRWALRTSPGRSRAEQSCRSPWLGPCTHDTYFMLYAQALAKAQITSRVKQNVFLPPVKILIHYFQGSYRL